LVSATLKLTDGYRLGQWVSQQRSRKESLTLERRKRLEGLIGWTWNTIDDEWKIGFKLLQEYTAEHGNCLVPQNFKLPNGYKLAEVS
jgi:hypothetical protein